ncbi:MAG: 3-isopropylmalate dehydratase small subunit [Caulobacterales bacterium]
MDKFKTVTGIAIPLGLANIDTDVIIPAAYLKTITREGLGKGAFETLRLNSDKTPKPDSVLNQKRYQGAPLLIAGDNFGCGSSREHAAWAIADLGIRAVIAPSFSDIFSSNAYKNGILTVVLPQAAIDRLMEVAKDGDITVDLDTQTVTTAYQDRFSFDLDPFRKHCLVNGLDEIGLTLEMAPSLHRFETALAVNRPWISAARQA